jgi:hypothetical protein
LYNNNKKERIMKIKKNGKVITLTESDLSRIVNRTIKKPRLKEQRGFEGYLRSITINDVISSIEVELESNGINVRKYEGEIVDLANNVMDGFEWELSNIGDTSIFMDLLDDLRR